MKIKNPVGRPRKSPLSLIPKEGDGSNGGKRTGAGRPRGSKNIYSHESVKKLEQLGFDPIEMMVAKYVNIEEKLKSGGVRVGSGAYAQLMAVQGQLINNLMQYGYKKIPEKQEIETSNKKPISVVLTTALPEET